MRSMLLLILIVVGTTVSAQTKYSKEDEGAILKKRVEGARAFQTTNRKLHYQVGAFHEKIFLKYRDTSIFAAVRHYTASTESEGDLMHNESLLAAFRLAEIYAKGMGIRTNIEKGYFYYLLSGKQGEEPLREMIKVYCREPVVEKVTVTTDTLVMRYSPFCINRPDRFAFLFPYMHRMREDPLLTLELQMFYPDIINTSYYSYYNTVHAHGIIGKLLVDYLLQNRVDPNRVVIRETERSARLYHTMQFIVRKED